MVGIVRPLTYEAIHVYVPGISVLLDIVGFIWIYYHLLPEPDKLIEFEVNFSSFLIQKYHQQAVEKGRLCPPFAMPDGMNAY